MGRRKKQQQKGGGKRGGNNHKAKENGKQNGSQKKKKQQPQKPKGPELEDELYRMGLRVKYMTADGNCLFRSLGDQLYGHDRDHSVIRSAVMDFMVDNRALFELFVEPCLEENEDFDSYIAQMRQDGHWAGDFEVHAASLCFEVDICIYQIDNENLQCLCNKNPGSKRVVHVSYHGGEHYNSVRKIGDYEDLPPQLIKISESNHDQNFPKQNWSWKDEKRIMEDTGCHNDGLIHTYLQEYDGDVQVVIERVIEWMRENHYESNKLSLLDADETNPLTVDCVVSDDETEQEGTASQSPRNAGALSSAETEEQYPSGNKVLREDIPVVMKKKPPNNKPCPCGSNLPYKKCCKIIEAKRQRETERREEYYRENNSPREAVSRQMAVLYI